MTRNIKELFSWNALRHLGYLFHILLKVKNWYAFSLNYAGIKNEALTYHFRNGMKIKTNEGVDTRTIVVVFFKKEYGKIGNNTTVIDIGGNLGAFSIYAATHSENTKVFAYEPMTKTYSLLEENIRLNNLQKSIAAFNYGVGSNNEKRKLFLTGGSPFNTLYPDFYPAKPEYDFVEIQLVTLDNIFLSNKIDQCDLIKCDCEGAEYEIFYNTSDFYLGKVKEIRLEYHNLDNNANHIDQLTAFLGQKGFTKIFDNPINPLLGNAWFKRLR